MDGPRDGADARPKGRPRGRADARPGPSTALSTTPSTTLNRLNPAFVKISQKFIANR